jgi:hypothetical protein
VVSRAYYGAFLMARDNAGIKKDASSVHQDTINHYETRSPKIGNRLKSLRRQRNIADYELDARVGQRESGEALKLSKQIQEALSPI